MKTLTRFSYTLAVLVSLAFSAHAQTIYVATGSNGIAGTLYTYDVGTQDLINSVALTNSAGGGGIGITGLAFNPLTGTLYGVTVNATGTSPTDNTVRASLVSVNPTTGVCSVIGSLGNNIVLGDIAFSSNGTLYGWEGRSQNGMVGLVTVNLMTGAVTNVGPTQSNTIGGGIAINSSGTAYLSFTGASPTSASPPPISRGTLDTVSLSTGVVTVGPTITGAPNDFGGIQGNGSMNALAFGPDGLLYAANSDQLAPGDVELVTINLVNGAVNDLFGLPNNTDAIAFNPMEIPEPSTLGLLIFGALGSVALMYYRRRQKPVSITSTTRRR